MGFGARISQQNYRDLETLAKYATGAAVVQQSEGIFDGMGMMVGITGVIEGFKGASWLWNNRKDGKIASGFQKGFDIYKAEYPQKLELFKNGGWKNAQTYKNFWNTFSVKTILQDVPSGDKLAKMEEAAKSSTKMQEALGLYKKAETAANAAKAEGQTYEQVRKSIKEANEAFAKARSLAHGQMPVGKISEAKGFWNQVGRTFKKGGEIFSKYTGLSKVNGYIKELATKSPIVEKLLKFGKGNGLFLAIEGGLEMFTQIIPTFSQLGLGAGLKQLFKSSVNVGASIGGFTGGMALGSAIGTAIFPGAGTVLGGIIGSALGMIVGTITSSAAKKVSKAIVGENELDKAKNAQAAQLAAQGAQSPQAAQQIMFAAAQKLQQEGINSEETKAVADSIRSLSQNQQLMAQAQPQTQNPSFSGQTNPNQFQVNQEAMNIFKKQSMAGQNDIMNKDFMAMSAGLV